MLRSLPRNDFHVETPRRALARRIGGLDPKPSEFERRRVADEFTSLRVEGGPCRQASLRQAPSHRLHHVTSLEGVAVGDSDEAERERGGDHLGRRDGDGEGMLVLIAGRIRRTEREGTFLDRFLRLSFQGPGSLVEGQSVRQLSPGMLPADVSPGRVGGEFHGVGSVQSGFRKQPTDDGQFLGHRVAHDVGDAEFVHLPFEIVGLDVVGRVQRIDDSAHHEGNVVAFRVIDHPPAGGGLPDQLPVQEHVVGLVFVAELPRHVAPFRLLDGVGVDRRAESGLASRIDVSAGVAVRRPLL